MNVTKLTVREMTCLIKDALLKDKKGSGLAELMLEISKDPGITDMKIIDEGVMPIAFKIDTCEKKCWDDLSGPIVTCHCNDSELSIILDMHLFKPTPIAERAMPKQMFIDIITCIKECGFEELRQIMKRSIYETDDELKQELLDCFNNIYYAKKICTSNCFDDLIDKDNCVCSCNPGQAFIMPFRENKLGHA